MFSSDGFKLSLFGLTERVGNFTEVGEGSVLFKAKGSSSWKQMKFKLLASREGQNVTHNEPSAAWLAHIGSYRLSAG